MFYRKNLYAWEQVTRLIVGLAMIPLAPVFLPGWLGYLIAAGGGLLAITGVFG